jgi:glutathione peroxidase
MANELSALALTRLDGSSDSLAQHAGKVLLVVNVASQCGLTPQYEGWKLYTTYRDQGFEVLGFPANDFGNQEPGSAKDIDQFCKVNYGVSLPLFAKAPVSGGQAAALCCADGGGAGQAGAGGGVSREAEGLWYRGQ